MTRIQAYVTALGERNATAVAALFTANGTVWSTSSGRRSPPLDFFAAFLPSLVSAHAELLDVWCHVGLGDTRRLLVLATFRFLFVEEAGAEEEGGIYVDEFTFEDGRSL